LPEETASDVRFAEVGWFGGRRFQGKLKLERQLPGLASTLTMKWLSSRGAKPDVWKTNPLKAKGV
jgi:hypothetical protein